MKEYFKFWQWMVIAIICILFQSFIRYNFGILASILFCLSVLMDTSNILINKLNGGRVDVK